MTRGLAEAPVSVTGVSIAGVAIGPQHPVRVIAGPCSVEGREQFRTTAHAVKAAGATLLRGGAFKPRTSPYSFQGLGEEGLRIMRAVADELGMAVTTEAMSAEEVPAVARHADMVQIGARNRRPEHGQPIAARGGGRQWPSGAPQARCHCDGR
jgi:3-deoxy-7-phosphoheptulonate synthase